MTVFNVEGKIRKKIIYWYAGASIGISVLFQKFFIWGLKQVGKHFNCMKTFNFLVFILTAMFQLYTGWHPNMRVSLSTDCPSTEEVEQEITVKVENLGFQSFEVDFSEFQK